MCDAKAFFIFLIDFKKKILFDTEKPLLVKCDCH